MIKKDDYTNMIILTLVALILLCYRRKSKIEAFNSQNMAYVMEVFKVKIIWKGILLMLSMKL